MNTATPVRVQLSRCKGFKLQALSRETNGLPAVVVTRNGAWGNPWRIGAHNRETGRPYTREEAITTFKTALSQGLLRFDERDVQLALRGKNLACTCRLADLCHADVLLEIANK